MSESIIQQDAKACPHCGSVLISERIIRILWLTALAKTTQSSLETARRLGRSDIECLVYSLRMTNKEISDLKDDKPITKDMHSHYALTTNMMRSFFDFPDIRIAIPKGTE
jgi:hypothetical protein